MNISNMIKKHVCILLLFFKWRFAKIEMGEERERERIRVDVRIVRNPSIFNGFRAARGLGIVYSENM